MQLPLRLRSVLGTDTRTVDAAKIAGLLGWKEDADLDFKQALNRTPEGRRDLVADVVAMANARGGVIVVGIREEDTQAVELTPLRPGERREDRPDIYQAVAELTAPPVSLDVQQVEAGDGTYYLLLTVPKSHLAPHAFRRPGTPNLRYPVREGTRTRYLAEPELADRYIEIAFGGLLR
jgi:predicted HTH transcriptional regulator